MTGAKESKATGITSEGFSSQVFEDELTVDERGLAAADVRLLGLMRRSKMGQQVEIIVHTLNSSLNKRFSGGSNGRNVHRVLFFYCANQNKSRMKPPSDAEK